VLVADEAVGRGVRALPAYTLAIVAASLIGSFAGHEMRVAVRLPDHDPPITPRFPQILRFEVASIAIFLASLATIAHVSRRNALAARRRQAEAETARAQAQRRSLESELQALQARIEPGFLFGTLDRIRELYRADAKGAGAMLGDLISYLRAALPHLRESVSTVDQELALARAWLDIVGRSMQGLAVDIDADASIRGAPLPALVLLPVVQRALADAHGEARTLRIRAERRDASLHLCIATSTAAFAEDASDTLQSLADRLRALYGERADLRFEATADGSRAELDIPLETRTEGIPS
jgi:LytS/YehU family sensor histidine kinase